MTTVKSPKKAKKEAPSNVIKLPPTKNEKVIELITLLNTYHLGPYNKELIFWHDNSSFGDIVGLVPVERFYEVKKGSIYSEYKENIKDGCFKFVVIDVSNNNNNFSLNEEDIKKKKILENKNILYFKHPNVNFIYNEIINIS
jgi:hypothetical protein